MEQGSKTKILIKKKKFRNVSYEKDMIDKASKDKLFDDPFTSPY